MYLSDIQQHVEEKLDVSTIWDIRLVPTTDIVYTTLQRSKAMQRRATQNAWSSRNTGEVVGYRVEEAIRAWLSDNKVNVANERVIMWRDTVYKNSTAAQELDAVVKLRGDKLMLFEIKVVSEESARKRTGVSQLLKAEKRLLAGGVCKEVIKRLVYVSVEEHQHPDIPTVTLKDKKTDIGVIWISPAQVELLAEKHEIPLVDGWHLSEVRSKPLHQLDSVEAYVSSDKRLSMAAVETPMSLAFKNARNRGWTPPGS